MGYFLGNILPLSFYGHLLRGIYIIGLFLSDFVLLCGLDLHVERLGSRQLIVA